MFHADRLTHTHTNAHVHARTHTHMTKLIVAFHNFVKMPKIGLLPLRTDAVIEKFNNHRALTIIMVICSKILSSYQLKRKC